VVRPPDLLAGVTRQFSPALSARLEESRSPCCASTTSPLTPSRLPIPGVALPASAVDGALSFRALTESLGSRIEIIVHFLALLRLCKLAWLNSVRVRRSGRPDLVTTKDQIRLGRVDVYVG